MSNPRAVPIINLPFLYINGLQVLNDATTPNSKIDISIGRCRDVNNTFDMVSNSVIVVNGLVNGLNGLDTGALAASKVYAVYLVSDPVSGLPIGAILSLSFTGPLMPFGYSAYRLIGYAVTSGATAFLKMYTSGNNNARKFTYDAPIATAVVAGASAAYAPVALANFVPPVDQLPVMIQTKFTAAAAGNTLNLQGGNSVGDQVAIVGQIAGLINNADVVLAQLVTALPVINYKVSAGAVAINVCGFDYYV